MLSEIDQKMDAFFSKVVLFIVLFLGDLAIVLGQILLYAIINQGRVINCWARLYFIPIHALSRENKRNIVLFLFKIEDRASNVIEDFLALTMKKGLLPLSTYTD